MNKKTIIPPDSAFEFNPLLDDPEDVALIKDFETNGENWIHHINVKKQISIRLPEAVLNKLRIMAEKEGLRYQTFINSILTKYANTH